jgi:hypothetical protein
MSTPMVRGWEGAGRDGPAPPRRPVPDTGSGSSPAAAGESGIGAGVGAGRSKGAVR